MSGRKPMAGKKKKLKRRKLEPILYCAKCGCELSLKEIVQIGDKCFLCSRNIIDRKTAAAGSDN